MMSDFKAIVFAGIAGFCVLVVLALVLFSLITRPIWALAVPVLIVIAAICEIRAVEHWLFKE